MAKKGAHGERFSKKSNNKKNDLLLPPMPKKRESEQNSQADDITACLGQLDNNDGGNDQRAVQVIWDRFFSKMVGVAHKKMAALPKAVRDEEDVALSAMHSFIMGAEAGKFHLKNRDELWRLLVTITMRKASAERRRQHAAKRGGGAIAQQPHADESFDPIDQVVDENQMPELIDDVMKACAELLETLDDEALRRTAEMKMQGCSIEEISETPWLQNRRNQVSAAKNSATVEVALRGLKTLARSVAICANGRGPD